MKFDLHAPTDVRRLPGHRRLDPNISTFDDDGVIRNQQYGGAWAQILQCVAQNVTFTAPSATEASDILSEILVPAEDPPGSPLHPLRMASGEPYPDFVARFTQKVALCINSLDMLGVKAERAPRQHELCVSFTNAITNALKHKLRHAESLLPPTERLQKDSQDMDYILSLVASASHFEETKSSLLADPPKSGKPSPDPRSKYTGAKHSDSNTEYKRSDFGKRDTGQQRKRDSSRSVSMPAVQMAPDEPDIQLPKAARDEYARLGKTEYQQKQRDDRKCLNCGDTGTINGQKVPTHRARDCPYQRADGEPKHHRGDRLIPASPSTALPATRSRRNKRDPSPTTAEVNVPAGVSDGPGETDEFPVSMVATTRHVEGQGPNTFAHLSLVAMTPSLPTEGTPPDPGHTCDKRGHDAQDLDAEKLDAQAFFKSHGGIPSRDSAISRQDRAAQRKTPLSWCTATTVLSPGQFAGRQEDNDGRQETPPPMPPPSPELASVAAPKSDTLPPLTLAMPENNPNVSGLFPPSPGHTRGLIRGGVPAEDPAPPRDRGDDPESPPSASPDPTQESPSRVEEIFAVFTTDPAEPSFPPSRPAPDAASTRLEALVDSVLKITHNERDTNNALSLKVPESAILKLLGHLSHETPLPLGDLELQIAALEGFRDDFHQSLSTIPSAPEPSPGYVVKPTRELPARPMTITLRPTALMRDMSKEDRESFYAPDGMYELIKNDRELNMRFTRHGILMVGVEKAPINEHNPDDPVMTVSIPFEVRAAEREKMSPESPDSDDDAMPTPSPFAGLPLCPPLSPCETEPIETWCLYDRPRSSLQIVGLRALALGQPW